jgi:asparagine synthase (glutamine-hydrolysing)
MRERLDSFDPYEALDLPSGRIGRWHPLNRSLYFAYKVMLPGMLLHAKGDRVAMRSSVEARYPFLDQDFVELCASVHPSYKRRGSTNKWLLRQVAGRTLPPGMADRPKGMFQAGRASIFLGPERPSWVDRMLAPEAIRVAGYFDERRVWQARRRFTRSRPGTILWSTLESTLASVVATQLWHHHWIEPLCELGTHARSAH